MTLTEEQVKSVYEFMVAQVELNALLLARLARVERAIHIDNTFKFLEEEGKRH